MIFGTEVARALSLRSQARIARAAIAEHGRDWPDYDRILEIIVDMENEAAELERSETA